MVIANRYLQIIDGKGIQWGYIPKHPNNLYQVFYEEEELANVITIKESLYDTFWRLGHLLYRYLKTLFQNNLDQFHISNMTEKEYKSCAIEKVSRASIAKQKKSPNAEKFGDLVYMNI